MPRLVSNSTALTGKSAEGYTWLSVQIGQLSHPKIVCAWLSAHMFLRSRLLRCSPSLHPAYLILFYFVFYYSPGCRALVRPKSAFLTYVMLSS